MHLTFYSRKEQRLEQIVLEPTADGWHLTHDCYRGSVDSAGAPHLTRCLDENYTPYPSAFIDAFSEVWDALRDGALNVSEAQLSLDRLSQWLQGYAKDPNFKISDLSNL